MGLLVVGSIVEMLCQNSLPQTGRFLQNEGPPRRWPMLRVRGVKVAFKMVTQRNGPTVVYSELPDGKAEVLPKPILSASRPPRTRRCRRCCLQSQTLSVTVRGAAFVV